MEIVNHINGILLLIIRKLWKNGLLWLIKHKNSSIKILKNGQSVFLGNLLKSINQNI
jgi:hypothetical protein